MTSSGRRQFFARVAGIVAGASTAPALASVAPLPVRVALDGRVIARVVSTGVISVEEVRRLEDCRFQAEDVCRVFNVPPKLIVGAGGGATS